MEWCGSPLRWEKNQDPSSTPEQGWQDGAGGLLLVAAVHETGLLTHFESAIASCLTQISHPQLSPSSRSQRSLLITLCSSSRPGYLCRFFPYNEALFSTLLTQLPWVSTFAGTGPNSEQRISSRGLTSGLHWPIAPQSPQTIEQGRWFQPVGEIFINKGQTNRSILREQKRGWHRQLP